MNGIAVNRHTGLRRCAGGELPPAGEGMLLPRLGPKLVESGFRRYSLDGAVLYFHPPSGTQLRIASSATAAELRRAPRVVMFGITNECNLHCEHCSRDTARASQWTVESAAEILEGLAHAGTLEVAFGGGEPFTFEGFPELVARLRATTSLALHVTTNGSLLNTKTWAPLAGRLGQVRISVYDGRTWRDCAALFADTGQLWGANLLIDPAALGKLPAQLAELAAAGCHDVSLLSYVGVPERLLTLGDQRELARIVKNSPIQCRLSVCLGDTVPVRRLMAGFDNDGDCGAGSDFIAITPDRQVQRCSYQADGRPARSADEVLTAWTEWRQAERLAAPRSGCARNLPVCRNQPELPPIAVWRAFSGNNSGECILVAKFHTVEDAEKYLAELLPGWQLPAPAGKQRRSSVESEYSAEWRELFVREQVAGPGIAEEGTGRERPSALLALGSSVLAWGYGCSDTFPELRALAWKRGAWVCPSGSHVHGVPSLIAAVRVDHREEIAALTGRLPIAGAQCYGHGDSVFVTLPLGGDPEYLAEIRTQLVAWANGRRLAAEIIDGEIEPQAMINAKKHLGEEIETRPRLWITFFGFDAEARQKRGVDLAQTLQGESVLQLDSWVLVDPARGRKRLAVLAYRHGGHVEALDGTRVTVSAAFWSAAPVLRGKNACKPPALEVQLLEKELRNRVPNAREMIFTAQSGDYRKSSQFTLDTEEPEAVLLALQAAARSVGANFSLWIRDRDPLGGALRRLLRDLH